MGNQSRLWSGRVDFSRIGFLPGPSLETAGKAKWWPWGTVTSGGQPGAQTLEADRTGCLSPGCRQAGETFPSCEPQFPHPSHGDRNACDDQWAGPVQQALLLDSLLRTSGSLFVIRSSWDLVASRTFVCSDSLYLQPFPLPPVFFFPSLWAGHLTTDRHKAGKVSFLASSSLRWLCQAHPGGERRPNGTGATLGRTLRPWAPSPMSPPRSGKLLS